MGYAKNATNGERTEQTINAVEWSIYIELKSVYMFLWGKLISYYVQWKLNSFIKIYFIDAQRDTFRISYCNLLNA